MEVCSLFDGRGLREQFRFASLEHLPRRIEPVDRVPSACDGKQNPSRSTTQLEDRAAYRLCFVNVELCVTPVCVRRHVVIDVRKVGNGVVDRFQTP